MKGDGRITDNTVDSINVYEVSVMGVTLPDYLINSAEAGDLLVGSINNSIEKVTAKTDSEVELLEFVDGSVRFRGSIPSSIERVPIGAE